MKKLLLIFFLVLLHSKVFAEPTFVDSFSVNSEEDEPRGITFNNNGTKMFIIGWRGDDVNEYTLSTAWDVSTATFVDSTSSIDADGRDVRFNPDGTKMFVAGNLVGVHSNTVFTPVATGRITELVTSSNPNGEIKKGFNTVGTDYKYIGTATVAEALVDGNGTIRNADSYLVSDGDDTTVGALTIQNNAGLRVGLNKTQNYNLQTMHSLLLMELVFLLQMLGSLMVEAVRHLHLVLGKM